MPNHKKLKCLVTGGAGFIGLHLCKRLEKDGHDVVLIDNLSTSNMDSYTEVIPHIPKAEFLPVDVRILHTDFDLYRDGSKPDVIFHLAALSRIQPSFDNPSETFDNNTMGTQRVLEYARQAGVKRVIFSGSSSRHHNPYISPYATSKYLAEELCKMYRTTYGMDIHIARFYNVYGPGEILDGDWAAVIGKWRNQISKGEKITIVGNGEQRRAFTHVDDIVDGLIKIMLTEHSVDDAWELGTKENHSMNELFLMFKTRFPHIDYEYIPDQKGNYRETSQKNMAANVLLNWYPHNEIYDYIRNL